MFVQANDIDWVAAGGVIHVIPPSQQAVPDDRESRLRLFDRATERHRTRPSARKGNAASEQSLEKRGSLRGGRSR